MANLAMAADERRAAVHEAAHAVVAHALGREVRRVELHGLGQDGLVTGMTREAGWSRPLDVAMVALAGPLAEALASGMAMSPGAGTVDVRHAREVLGGQGVDDAARQALGLVIERWPQVKAVAQELLSRGQMDGNDMETLMRSGAKDSRMS